ncbi:hypothetical protein PFL02_52530 [Pseudomonas fluorescens]|nr:hypothetical protein PFL02_52530 [Pseudomonas fluorescens]
MSGPAWSRRGAKNGEKTRILGGGLGTVVYLVIIAITVALKFDNFLALKLNELGDFLAGVFGPIAFLWLVLGFLQQGRELKLSSDALQLQAQELKNSVEQQAELVKATKTSLANYEMSLEPLLKISAYTSSSVVTSSGQVMCDQLSIHNAGAYCENLLVSVLLGNDKKGIVSCAPLDKGQTHSLGFNDLFLDGIYYDLRVTYNKSNGVAGEQVFEVRRTYEGGQYSMSIEKMFP